MGGECKVCWAWPPQWGHFASPCASRPPQWLQRTSVVALVTSARAASARFCGRVSGRPRGTAVGASCSASTSASRASSPVCSSGASVGGPPRVCDGSGRALAAVTPVAATGSSVLAARRASDLGERSGSSGRAPRAAQRGIMVPVTRREEGNHTLMQTGSTAPRPPCPLGGNRARRARRHRCDASVWELARPGACFYDTRPRAREGSLCATSVRRHEN